MPNGVKYSTTTPSGSLRRDNVALGVNGNLGPTANTGFYSMPTPASGKYIINKVAASGVPLFYAPQNDTELIQFARNEGATGADTGSVAAVLAWIATQPNLEAANFEYENIVTSGLIFNLDAGFVGSYPTIGTTWYDLSGNANNGTLLNGPTFTSTNSGSIITDGVDDTIQVNYGFSTLSTITINFFANSSYNNESMIWAMGSSGPDWYIKADTMGYNSYRADTYGLSTTQINNLGLRNNWRLLTMTYTQNSPVANNKVYVNGVEQSTSQQLGGTNGMSFNNSINFASAFNNGGYNLAATIGNISIYNRALTSSEVLQNYNALKGRFGL
jgi:hypothetical protein